MAVNLADRATAQLGRLRTRADQAGAALAASRAELDRRHPDPSEVAPAAWATELGATQHVAAARAALSAERTEQDGIRVLLAGVGNPADTATFEDELRASLIEDAALRVQLRQAEERVAGAEGRLGVLGDVVGASIAAVATAESEAKAATRRQADGDALRAALAESPLDTVVADATDHLTDATFSAAEDRLAALLPEPLRLRAVARAAEAEDVVVEAAAHQAAGATVSAGARLVDAPLDTAVEVAERAFVLAEGELRRYVFTAAADLAAAEATLTALAALPSLSTAQVAALDPDDRTDAVAAADTEQDLSTAVAAFRAAQRAVDDAIVAALVADPDADPEADPAVIAAVEARDDAAVVGPLGDARTAYDDDARAALDAWEVEVPHVLWQGLADLHAASRTLGRLADQAVRDALVTSLDAAQDALAAALDDRDVQVRRELAAAVALAPRAGASAAADATPSDRIIQYLRGDGPGGRTPGEL